MYLIHEEETSLNVGMTTFNVNAVCENVDSFTFAITKSLSNVDDKHIEDL